MFKLILFLFLFFPSISWGDIYVYPPIYTANLLLKNPVSINNLCTNRNSKDTIEESFRDGLEKNSPYAKGNSPLIYTILEYHIETMDNTAYYCFTYTSKDNIK